MLCVTSARQRDLRLISLCPLKLSLCLVFVSAKVERKAREGKKKDEKMHFSQFVVAALRIGLDKLSIVARWHCAEVLRKPPDRGL